MEQKYDYSEIPAGWKYCFNRECPRSGECLRYQTGLDIPADRTWGQAVFPAALKADGRCEFFRKDEKVTLATGFITDNPRVNDMFVTMRHRLTYYLGGNGTYYLYRNGKKWLTPEQQAGIRNIFRQAGYKDDIHFSATKECYNFL